jgi:hypothetical protein
VCVHKCVLCGNTSDGYHPGIDGSRPACSCQAGCAAAAVQHRTPAPAASRVPAALLAVFAGAPDQAVGAHSFAAACGGEGMCAHSRVAAKAPEVAGRGCPDRASMASMSFTPHPTAAAVKTWRGGWISASKSLSLTERVHSPIRPYRCWVAVVGREGVATSLPCYY